MYEPRGARGRETGVWNCHQFHADSEVYADFGRYRVAITLPKRFVVGATGERRENADGSSTHVFEQADVIDFAWTASPRFVELGARFSGEADVTAQEYAETAALLGRSVEELRLGDVEETVLQQPEHASQAERHVRAAKSAIKWFGLWYGRYPYPTLTVADPAFGALGSAGMEYPTFSTGKVMERVYGPWLVQALGLRLGGLELSELQNPVERMCDRVRTPSWQNSSSGNYSFRSYARTELPPARRGRVARLASARLRGRRQPDAGPARARARGRQRGKACRRGRRRHEPALGGRFKRLELPSERRLLAATVDPKSA